MPSTAMRKATTAASEYGVGPYSAQRLHVPPMIEGGKQQSGQPDADHQQRELARAEPSLRDRRLPPQVPKNL